MRPRFTLMLFGFLTAVVALLALAKNSIPPSILGSVISDKIAPVPSSPALYFGVFLVLGVVATIIAVLERKIVY